MSRVRIGGAVILPSDVSSYYVLLLSCFVLIFINILQIVSDYDCTIVISSLL